MGHHLRKLWIYVRCKKAASVECKGVNEQSP